MHPNAAVRLTELGTPNNILTRTVYRVGYAMIYVLMYVIVYTVAFVMRKDRMEVLIDTADKIAPGHQIPRN